MGHPSTASFAALWAAMLMGGCSAVPSRPVSDVRTTPKPPPAPRPLRFDAHREAWNPTPPAPSSPPSLSGQPIPMEAFQRTVAHYGRQVRFCYEKRLLSDHSLAGRIVVRFRITGDGDVVSAELTESTVANPDFEACVVDSMKTWVFKAPRGGGDVLVNYPWVFNPED